MLESRCVWCVVFRDGDVDLKARIKFIALVSKL